MEFRILKLFAPLLLIAVATMGCDAFGGDDQEYPSSQVTLIVPYSPGGSGDPVARQFAEQLGESLGTSVVVENREGGSGTIGTGAVSEAEPDGYTIGYGSPAPLALQTLVNQDLPYDGPEDLQPLVKIGYSPITIAVRDDAPWQTFDEFLDHARENPGEVQVSVGGQPNTKSLQLEELSRAADVDINIVPFSGGGSEAITALQGDRVDAVSVNPPGLEGPVEAGDIRVLGTFTEEPYEGFPESIPIVDAGYGEMTALEDSIFFIAPEGLPEDVRETLSEASWEVSTSEEFTQFVEENGYISEPKDPEESAADLRETQETYSELLE